MDVPEVYPFSRCFPIAQSGSSIKDSDECIGAVNPRVRDLRRGVIFLALGVAGLLCSLFFPDPEVFNSIRAGSMFPLLLGGRKHGRQLVMAEPPDTGFEPGERGAWPACSRACRSVAPFRPFW
jgi:hypothetical protein